MKSRYFTFGLIATMCAGNSFATDLAYNANSIAAHNIMTVQHTIVNRATVLPVRENTPAKADDTTKDSDDYGEMVYYGEYGDDTGILPLVGRNGGDNSSAYIGADWQHIDDKVKFKSYPHMDTNLDFGIIEFGNNYETLYGRPLDLKFFGGYVGGRTKNDAVRIGQDGGFVGILAHQGIDNLDINVVGNFGLMVNDVRELPTTDDFNNIWASINLDLAYNFVVDEYVVIRPNVRGGYMWIYSPNYELKNGENINNKNFAVFELTPGVEFDANIGNGWLVGAHGAYVMNFTNGGETYVAYSRIEKIKIDDYFEYGIKVEKHMGDLNFGLNVGRHDGGRTGWFGGVNIKYLF